MQERAQSIQPSNPQSEKINDQQAVLQMLQGFVRPWQESLANPGAAQERVLKFLLKSYAATGYGKKYGAAQIQTLADFRRSLPVVTYDDYKPLIQQVMAGDTSLLLDEEPVGWAITRGTTGDEEKFIPMTTTDIKMRVSAARAMIMYALSSHRFDIFQGVNLNLNFPSVVGKVKAGEKELEYGYSSGIYVKHVSKSTPIHSLPAQEEIDALGGGKTIRDWEARFELTYQKCKDQNVTMVGGVAPVAIRFGQYLEKKHKVFPKDLWPGLQILTLGSVPGINTLHEAGLRAYYGKAAIREIYGATEGMFGQQMDEKRAWTPNYDLFLLEVQIGSTVKLLHEMRPGEVGSLIVSTPILARYKIGDCIRAFPAPYFRCIGRDRWWTQLAYYWNEFMSLNLNRL
jgi:hypothetical protein